MKQWIKRLYLELLIANAEKIPTRIGNIDKYLLLRATLIPYHLSYADIFLMTMLRR